MQNYKYFFGNFVESPLELLEVQLSVAVVVKSFHHSFDLSDDGKSFPFLFWHLGRSHRLVHHLEFLLCYEPVSIFVESLQRLRYYNWLWICMQVDRCREKSKNTKQLSLRLLNSRQWNEMEVDLWNFSSGKWKSLGNKWCNLIWFAIFILSSNGFPWVLICVYSVVASINSFQWWLCLNFKTTGFTLKADFFKISRQRFTLKAK